MPRLRQSELFWKCVCGRWNATRFSRCANCGGWSPLHVSAESARARYRAWLEEAVSAGSPDGPGAAQGGSQR